MKSNLAILSSDTKSINFIKNLNLNKICNMYANCSRNVEVAEKFSKEYGFLKYYGSYEELLNDKNIDFIINFLPSGIKFEYNYLFLKNNFKVITDYPIITSNNELYYYQEIIKKKLSSNIFLIDNYNFSKFFKDTNHLRNITYYKNIQNFENQDNSLSNRDILFELCPDLFFFINQYQNSDIKIDILNKVKDKITNKISYINCIITIDSKIKLQTILDNGHIDNSHIGFEITNTNEIKDFIYNKDDLINFINLKKPFDISFNFQYYPFKLFQEVFNE